MAIMLDLRQAVVHKMYGRDQQGLRELIEGSIDAQEAALPGLGVAFEIIWKRLESAKQDELVAVLNQALQANPPKPIR
ncbi:small, acid-soluble spore protein I [Paenibacillus sp. CAA11]|uniref:small acid-soluble spore protein SspI n=1 Tax=Paenibacillus sp. CAA11 TaxID=1532905 RepID=UPI000D3B3800|nr:small acid-soluble spore protein SspI [Paenibacillus sp. CAA11]AWB45936.1 small, acid-soluble spore protein I [Paenibacillus sp. CAA11]